MKPHVCAPAHQKNHIGTMTPRIHGKTQPRRAHATASPQELHLCGDCDSRFVHPRAIERRGENGWKLDLHCPECGWTETGVFPENVIEEFEKELERGYAELERSLAHLARDNMADYVDRFASALTADAIHPMDF
jgi:hypothetical protein